jgi:hypothetical protein
MAIKKGNRTEQITLQPYHQKKLNVIRTRLGEQGRPLSKTKAIQRLIEQYRVFDGD